MKQIREGLDSIGLGIFFLGLFLGLGTCSQKASSFSKTDFQYCFDYVNTWEGAEKSRICFEKLKQIQDQTTK